MQKEEQLRSIGQNIRKKHLFQIGYVSKRNLGTAYNPYVNITTHQVRTNSDMFR